MRGLIHRDSKRRRVRLTAGEPVKRSGEFVFEGIWLPRRNAPRTRSASVGFAERRAFSSIAYPPARHFHSERTAWEQSLLAATCTMAYESSGEVTMTRQELLSRITVDPQVCFGKPCIRGHRIWVALVLDFLASGMKSEEILKEYPGIDEADILACIAYGAEMSRERYIDIPAEGAG